MNKVRNKSQLWGGLFSLISVVMAFAATSANANFCLRETYGRGVGTIPAACADGDRVLDEGLCYKKCEGGWEGNATGCSPKCPSGWVTDTVAFCIKPKQSAPYGVGAGYAWKGGDPAFNYDKAGDRCRAAHSEGCVRDGLIWYPNCKAGFYKTGALICSPNEIKCPDKFADLGLMCGKPVTNRGVGTIPNACGSGKQFDAGLCYDNCKAGFAGVGPACGQQCTGATSVSCGVVGCAASTKDCTDAVMGPIVQVWEVYASAVGNGVVISIESARIIVQKVRAAVSVASFQLGGMTIDQVLGEYGRKAGVAFTAKQLDNMKKALSGQDFDPAELQPHVNALIKAYSKPQVCRS